VIVIIATLGITQASSGYNQQSMWAFPWILFWRFVLGIGIGAEHPLSALIASEWSSTRSQGRILAAIFLMQPLGQLAAYAIGYVALVGIVNSHHLDWNEKASDIAAPVIDIVWRCVIGVGGISTLIAYHCPFFDTRDSSFASGGRTCSCP
jgi:MFS transporter, PHS family, inorganic phosphate transporter